MIRRTTLPSRGMTQAYSNSNSNSEIINKKTVFTSCYRDKMYCKLDSPIQEMHSITKHPVYYAFKLVAVVVVLL